MLLYNAMRTPDGTLLESLHRHDYREHQDANGETYTVDGGNAYMRRSVNKEAGEDLSLSTHMDHELLRDKVVWGTYGIDGDQPLSYIKLKDMDTEHIQAVLGLNIDLGRTIVYQEELRQRENNDG